jgi:hypothetical protein
MAFPTNSVLEAFTGTDGATLDADWSLAFAAAIPKINANQASNVTADNAYVAAYWDLTTFGPDSEAYATITTGDYVGMYARVVDPGTGTSDSYQASWSGSSLSLQRNDNGVSTQLGSTVTLSKTTGHKLGIEAIGSAIKVYVDSGSGWVERISQTDGTYTAAGFIAFDIFDAAGTQRVDDFGGGTVVTAAAISPSLLMAPIAR